MTEPKRWPLITTIVVYWAVLIVSVFAFGFLFMAMGMTPGNYHLKPSEILVFSMFPVLLLGCKFYIYKLRKGPGVFTLLTLASVIPLLQILIIVFNL
jgi:hypothetical protein